MWNKVNAHEMSTCLYLAFMYRLHTLDRISNWNSIQDAKCKLCNSEDETHEHLFFQCNYSNQIWQSVKQKLNLNHSLNDTLREVLEYLETRLQKKNSISNMIDVAIGTTVWHIWIERNQRTFQNKSIPAEIRLELILNDYKI